MQNKKRLLIIGLDGATFDLIDPWIKEGKLPTLAKISKLGVKQTLNTTIPPLTPCAWSSFATGKNPGKHGIYDFFFINENLELDVNTADERPGKDFWEILSDHGKKVIVFNVPMTFPPRKVNGIMISGFTTPDLQSNFTYPENFKSKLLRNFPNYQISENAKFSENYSDQKLFLDEIKKLTDIQFKVSKWLIKNFDWDVFVVVFNGTDHVQHWYWKYLDKTHPLYEENKEFKNAIYEVYKQADQIIEDLYYKSSPQNTSLMIISDHGAGQYLKNVYLNNWLYKKGYLKFKNTPEVLFKRILNKLNLNPQTLVKLALKIGLGKLLKKAQFKKQTGQINKFILTFEDVDWSKTKAYSFGYYGPIYINTKEKGWGGKVTKEEYFRLREKIKSQLKELTDPETGEKIIDKIFFKEDIYSGPLTDKLPDIIFSMKNYAYGSSSTFAFASNKTFTPPFTLKSGDHRENGIFLGIGPMFSGKKIRENISIMDIAPTVLKYFGITPPKDIDGKSLLL